MSLQKKLGYTDEVWKQIKEFAELQFEADVPDEDVPPEKREIPGVSLVVENWDVDINNPWLDLSARFPLSDEGAVKEYGFEFLKAWCEKADAYIKAHGFENLKKQLEKRIEEVQRMIEKAQ